MAISLINVGQIANDGTGDDLREAFIKINQNFEELDLRDDEQTTGSNIGAVGEGVFAQRVGYDLQFKKLVSGSNITLTATDNTITLDATGGLQSLFISSDAGSIGLADGQTLNINGGAGISTSLVGNVLTISNDGLVEIVSDTTPQLGGNLDAQGYSIINAGPISSSGFTGPLEGLVYGIDIREFNNAFNSFDFGGFNKVANGILDFIFKSQNVDLGTFANPDEVGIEGGGFVGAPPAPPVPTPPLAP